MGLVGLCQGPPWKPSWIITHTKVSYTQQFPKNSVRRNSTGSQEQPPAPPSPSVITVLSHTQGVGEGGGEGSLFGPLPQQIKVRKSRASLSPRFCIITNMPTLRLVCVHGLGTLYVKVHTDMSDFAKSPNCLAENTTK